MWPNFDYYKNELSAAWLGEWRRADWRRLPRPLAAVNGCFDLFGSHHAWILQNASRLGYLIVAVNSDDSVRRLKGEGRPVVSLDARLRIVSCCKGVRAVTWFDEDTPEELWSVVKPDYLCRLTVDSRPVAGEKYAARLVRFKPYSNRSTTQLIKDIACLEKFGS